MIWHFLQAQVFASPYEIFSWGGAFCYVTGHRYREDCMKRTIRKKNRSGGAAVVWSLEWRLDMAPRGVSISWWMGGKVVFPRCWIFLCRKLMIFVATRLVLCTWWFCLAGDQAVFAAWVLHWNHLVAACEHGGFGEKEFYWIWPSVPLNIADSRAHLYGRGKCPGYRNRWEFACRFETISQILWEYSDYIPFLSFM